MACPGIRKGGGGENPKVFFSFQFFKGGPSSENTYLIFIILLVVINFTVDLDMGGRGASLADCSLPQKIKRMFPCSRYMFLLMIEGSFSPCGELFFSVRLFSLCGEPLFSLYSPSFSLFGVCLLIQKFLQARPWTRKIYMQIMHES